MNKKFLISISVAITIASIVFILTNKSYSITGMFEKVFSTSLSQGEQYERNITIRKYYNTTIRFKKADSNSSSYLSFDSNDTLVILKDTFGNELARTVGLESGKAYVIMDYLDVSAIKRASAYGFNDYEDAVEQAVNVSYIGTKAYVTIYLTPNAARIFGFVTDELTNETVSSIELYAFEDNADPYMAEVVVQNATDATGRYELNFGAGVLGSFDVYIKDYSAS